MSVLHDSSPCGSPRPATPALLVLLKHPTPGRVKTRLAAEMGDAAAAELYDGWITRVFEQVQPLRPAVRMIALYAGAAVEAFAPWRDLADAWIAQSGGSLGERLARGFEQAFAAGGPVAAIGTDCLDINAELVRSAFAALAQRDAVFGPTFDGGYYLVGLARPLASFFDGVPWSTADTYRAHTERCRQRGWTVAELPPRRDIDTAADLAERQAEQSQ